MKKIMGLKKDETDFLESARKYSTSSRTETTPSEGASSHDSLSSQKRRICFLKHHRLLEDGPVSEETRRKECSAYMDCAEDIKDALDEKFINELETAIREAKLSGKPDMIALAKEAEKAATFFRKLQRFRHHVAPLSRSLISEIHAYRTPKDVVYNVVKATLLLLGEKEINLQYWEDMRQMLKKSGKDNILLRLKSLNPLQLSPKIVSKVSNLLEPYDQDSVAIASAGAGSLYVWIKSVTENTKTGNQTAPLPDVFIDSSHLQYAESAESISPVSSYQFEPENLSHGTETPVVDKTKQKI